MEVIGAGICGTDLHIVDGEYETVTPVTMGHEVAGTVAELGEGVGDAWLGARVASETYFSTCGRCAHCLAGRVNLCVERRSIGTHVDGAFAPRLHVPVTNLWMARPRPCASPSPACVTRCSSPSPRCGPETTCS